MSPVTGDFDAIMRTTTAWRTAGELGDVAAAVRCLAEEVVVISPLTARFRFRGREQVQVMLAAAFEVISDIRYHTEVGEREIRALFYHASCGSVQVEEAQLLRFDGAGRIVELTLFVRPLPALTTVMARIGPALVRRQGRPAMARVIGAATRPLAGITRIGDKSLVPLADPNLAQPRA